MRVIRNEQRIRVLGTAGKYAVIVGLLALVAALLIPMAQPGWLLPMLVCLALGYPLSIGGGLLVDRYGGPLPQHDALAKALKGLSDDHVLLQYVLPVPHVVMGPGGCTVLLVKAQGGEVVCQEEGRWKHRQRGKVFRQLAGQESLGAPDLEAGRQAAKLERWLDKRLPGVEVPVQAAIVFVNPRVTLDGSVSQVPVFRDKKVKSWLRGAGRLKPLPGDVQSSLAKALGATARA
jgi:hypothetical protein